MSVSGGPSPVSRLPPGLSISGGPGSSAPRLPPGISVSGGATLPPGINVSGGGNAPPVRQGGGPGPPPPRLEPGPGALQKPGGPGQHQRFQQNGQAQPQVRAQIVPDNFQQPRIHSTSTLLRHPSGPGGPRSRRPSSASSTGPSPNRSPVQTPPPPHSSSHPGQTQSYPPSSQDSQPHYQPVQSQSYHPPTPKGPRTDFHPSPSPSFQDQVPPNVQLSRSQNSQQHPDPPVKQHHLQHQQHAVGPPATAPRGLGSSEEDESQDSLQPSLIPPEFIQNSVGSPVLASEFLPEIPISAPETPVPEDANMRGEEKENDKELGNEREEEGSIESPGPASAASPFIQVF